MLAHNANRQPDIDLTHPIDFADLEAARIVTKLKNDLAAVFDHVHVRRPVLARLEIDPNCEPAFAKHGR